MAILNFIWGKRLEENEEIQAMTKIEIKNKAFIGLKLMTFSLAWLHSHKFHVWICLSTRLNIRKEPSSFFLSEVMRSL
jgi:hypothetical protein